LEHAFQLVGENKTDQKKRNNLNCRAMKKDSGSGESSDEYENEQQESLHCVLVVDVRGSVYGEDSLKLKQKQSLEEKALKMAFLIFASSHPLFLCSWLFVLFLHGESFTTVSATDHRFPRAAVGKYEPPSVLSLSSSPLWKKFSRTRTLGLRRMQSPTEQTEDDIEELEFSAEDYAADDNAPMKGHVDISTELELPFNAQVAFDAFSDLPRQPSWSPWLHSVSYIDPPTVENRETQWKLRYLGVRLSWNAVNIRFDRPRVIQWKSTSGMKNYGRVEFSPTAGPDDFTLMKMTLTFVVPGPVGRVFQNSERIKRIVKKRMLEPTLVKFSSIVMENDMQQKTGDGPPYL
jgi:uncharacterized membrane protein